MIFKLAFRNVISKRSSYVIILFMTFAVTLFCVANAIFDSTENGVQTTFVSSFTGDLIIRPESDTQLSLFGDETPVTGNLTKLNFLVPFSDITNTLNQLPQINCLTNQLTGYAAMEFNRKRYAVFLFGIIPESYFPMMPSVHIVDGQAFTSGQKGVMISKIIAEKFDISVGDEVQFTVVDGPYFRIRKLQVSGIYEYETNNSIFERYVLMDTLTLRSIMDISDSVVNDTEIEEEKSFLLDDDLDFDSLFEIYSDSESANQEITDDDIFLMSDAEELENSDFDESKSWNYIICKLNEGEDSKKVIKKLNKIFRANGWPVEATDWRHAAGSTALYLYWMRLIFNIGIAVVLIAGFIIVNNTLTINVLDRTREIGTLRAVGAKKRFISAQCMVETFMMTLTSGVLGSILGCVISAIITASHIKLNNSFLIQLFGAEALCVTVTPMNILKMFILVIVLGIIGWVYPVLTAIKVNPVKAMQGAK